MELKLYLKKRAKFVEKALHRFAPADKRRIAQAMRYSLFAGGKRLRPILLLEAAHLCGGKDAQFLPAACALEYVHTYSLIHDDLPAMDDDDLRRGKPTSHKRFDEATAILAGDGLLTEAFRLVTVTGHVPHWRIVRAVQILAEASGHVGMIEGQMQDTVESGAWRKLPRERAARVLEHIHLNKTGALIRASLVIGTMLAGGSDRHVIALDTYGKHIGLAFQIADDILDVEGNKTLLGKRGSDRENDKLTYVSLYGIDKARQMADAHVRAAKKAVSLFGGKKKILSELADYVVQRVY